MMHPRVPHYYEMFNYIIFPAQQQSSEMCFDFDHVQQLMEI